MSWFLVLPILISLTTALLCFGAARSYALEKAISVLGSAALLVSSIALLVTVRADGVIAGQMGGWQAPFGITLVADHLSAIMVLITGVVAVAVVIYALSDVDRRRAQFSFHSLFHILLCGICGAFLTGDLFNLYVWFEVMLIASFALLVLGGEKAQLDGAVKYVAINLVSTVLFLAAIGLLYGMTGTLNMAELHLAVGAAPNQSLLTTISILFLIAFGIKAAVFPLFFWLPVSYHTPPVTVSAIFAALLTKVGVYALIRVFTLIFAQDVAYTHTIILVVAALTMITGVLGAAAQGEFRRILSFHIISQIGYMVLGLALMAPLAIAGAVFYLVHHIIVKANLFLVSGVVRRFTGSLELERLGGLYKTRPWLAVLFFIPAFSLAGIPPLSGFWAKLLLIKASLDAEQYLIAFVVLAVGLMTIYSMTKIWAQVFLKPQPTELPSGPGGGGTGLMVLPIIILAAMTLAIGLFPQPLLAIAESASAELLNPATYVTAVLGTGR